MADPRFTSKFSARYTSDVIVRDVAEAINVILAKMGDPNIFVLAVQQALLEYSSWLGLI